MRGRGWWASLAVVALLALGAVVPGQAADEAPFALQGGGLVDLGELRVTVFAEGLAYPHGMAELADGSLLVATSEPTGGSYFRSTGALVRLVDEDEDGVADGPGQVLAGGLPGGLTDVRRAGDLVYAVSAGWEAPGITVLRVGVEPGDPLTVVGTIAFAYGVTMDHGTYAVATREDPEEPGRHDLFFNVGSLSNDTVGATVTASGLVSGELVDASIYRVRVDDSGPAPVFGAPERIAGGLRNAAGIAVDPRTGDLWFEDNGIDLPDDRIVPLSADELNRLPARRIGGNVEDYGFPSAYVDYATGERVGKGGLRPEVAFLPVDGSENEGAAGIALAPPGFPAGLDDGVFVGFHGQWDEVGLANEENPLVYVDRGSGEYVHIVGNDEPGVGHLDGLLATRDALYVSDLTGTGSLVGGAAGTIYRIAVAG